MQNRNTFSNIFVSRWSFCSRRFEWVVVEMREIKLIVQLHFSQKSSSVQEKYNFMQKLLLLRL